MTQITSVKISYKKKDFSASVMPFFNDKKGVPAIYLLEGMLGSGKTFIIKEVLRQLYGINTSSPTFAYFKKFDIVEASCEVLHFDLYRIEKINDFLEAGFLENLLEPKTICFVEWPSILKSYWSFLSLTKPVYLIKFFGESKEADGRNIEIFSLQAL